MQYRLHYRYPYLWPLLFAFLFFPVSLVLLLTGSSFESPRARYVLFYRGSRFWLALWTILFFPIAIVLFLINGMAVIKTEKDIEVQVLSSKREKG